MAQKRPFDDEVVNEVSSKHQKQDGPGTEIISRDDRFCDEADIMQLNDSGETNIVKDKVEYDADCQNGNCPVIFREGVEETENDASRSASLSHWATAATSDDEAPDEMLHAPFYSGYFSFDRPVRSTVIPDDEYHCLLDYPPRKPVPIGSEYQAEIPPWSENTSMGNISGNGNVDLNEICIVPNVDTQPLEHDILEIGDGRTECRCPDQGSIRCVRAHIVEARERLIRVLGLDNFMELGFNDMGEVVADNWTNEEEQLFHEIVYSNPASLGKNFWNALSVVFPFRTNMEIVSYYFNVFMLRKRAEQNRCDPTNIDSDNDEWQGCDSDEGDDVSDNDDGSGIESPTRHDDLGFHNNGVHVRDHEEDDGDVLDDARETDEKNEQGHTCSPDPDSTLEFTGKKSDVGCEIDAQDGSCTSSDSGTSEQGSRVKSDSSHYWHEFILDSNDAKAWDGYMSCPKSNVDLLPTCSMIEEVFGGDFDSKDKRC